MRILVAERDPFWRRRWGALDLGAPLELVDDGTRALERAFAEPPAAVVCEVLLPGIDGLTLVRRLRAHPLTSPLPVAVVSSLPFGDRAREAGADLFSQKPLADRDLRALVERLLADRAQGRTP
ncbi:MAG: response regulator [Candidatus Dadabacteria bacterium]|nr:MAG: response regulator [Candidatus Dadabacteria bacterium]